MTPAKKEKSPSKTQSVERVKKPQCQSKTIEGKPCRNYSSHVVDGKFMCSSHFKELRLLQLRGE